MKLHKTILGLLATVITVLSLFSVSSALAADVPPLEKRAAWFCHDRFGMFIHWGVYAVDGRGEWIQDTGKIPLQEYVKLYPKFDPQAI